LRYVHTADPVAPAARHGCGRRACQRLEDAERARERRAARPAPPRLKVCAAFGRSLPGVPLPDGRPSFCTAKPCAAARTRRWYATSERYREMSRVSSRGAHARRPVVVCADCGRERRLASRSRCRSCYKRWYLARRPELLEKERARKRDYMRECVRRKRAARQTA
jgi:hypothetical protein